MNYKKIIRSRKYRLLILKYINWIPDRIMLRIQYRIKMGFWPDFKNPQRFSEKLQLYKMRYRNPVMPCCVDKYEVRKYVESKGLGHILNELYGVYDKPEDIDFSMLPQSFVIKTTDGGGGLNVIVVKDKDTADYNVILKKLNLWNHRKKSSANVGREWAYDGDNPSRIIIEKLLEDSLTPSLIDYKFFCFNGVPVYCQVITGRWDTECIDFFDEKWNHQSFVGLNSLVGNAKIEPHKPSNYEEMWKLAGQLAADFPFVRVDLYSVLGKTVFGEMTFYPASGYGFFKPDSTDFELGSYFTEY